MYDSFSVIVEVNLVKIMNKIMYKKIIYIFIPRKPLKGYIYFKTIQRHKVFAELFFVFLSEQYFVKYVSILHLLIALVFMKNI